jgi:plastocyanin
MLLWGLLMRNEMMVFLVLMSVFLVIGCTGAQDDEDAGTESPEIPPADPEPVQAETPEPQGSEVYNYITEENNYRNWDLWPLKDEVYASVSIHGPLLTTYVSENAVPAIQNRAGTLPYGSMVVRESYDADRQLREIGVRYKVEGYDPDHNDWFWAAYTPEGEVIVEGRVESCQSCHSVEARNDYIYTAYITGTPYPVTDVEIRDFSFDPASVTIAVGDSVRWTNMDSAVHTIDGGMFRSGALAQGESYSYTFTKAGTYYYMCTVHPYQTTGQIIVTG